MTRSSVKREFGAEGGAHLRDVTRAAFLACNCYSPEFRGGYASLFAKLALAIFRLGGSSWRTMKKSVRSRRLADATLAIHAGEQRFHVSVPVGTSIARTANFTFANTEEMKRWAEGKSSAYIYTRYGNPTLAIAERKIAALEGAEAAIVAASGMAAISSALLSILKAGDEVIATRALYGGSYRLMRDIFPGRGMGVRNVETDWGGIERRVNPQKKVLNMETPKNPTL